MSRIAELADGTRLEFPDETPDEVMQAAVKKYIASQGESLIPSPDPANVEPMGEPSRVMPPGPADKPSLSDVMGWRESAMDLGRAEPQTPEETTAAGAGAAVGLGVASTAATAPMGLKALGASATGLTASILVGNYVEKKLGLPWWVGEAFALAIQKKPRGKAAKLFRDWLGRAEKGAAKAGAEKAKGTIVREATKELTAGVDPSRTMGTPYVTAAPKGSLPARATLTRIPMAPKRPGNPKWAGGGKAEIAWQESQGLRPNAMGPDDVLAMRARGATHEEIEAALLRSARPHKTPWGTPTPDMGEKPANWVPSGSKPRGVPAAAPKAPGGPKITGGTAGEAALSDIVKNMKAWRGTQKFSKPQIEASLREVYGIPKKEARELILLVLGG